ncbi:MAG: IS200/IS605 family transposase [Nanoarchaeota archaeon]|nr:IS200/IS605 family transposase [Nanoarchaeota archaeon]MBU1004882.1 IS200/IS605 family transposase [Nanoarchaeota archaeon]MBU1945407.1 IS200/IS605 family transposase [Nanoarchaeota archaeon]
MLKHKYPHFDSNVHEIKSKIATVRTGHHCKFNINYHIIWIPKYRKPVLKGEVKDVLRTIINGICYDIRLNMLALEIMPDHLHSSKIVDFGVCSEIFDF